MAGGCPLVLDLHRRDLGPLLRGCLAGLGVRLDHGVPCPDARMVAGRPDGQASRPPADGRSFLIASTSSSTCWSVHSGCWLRTLVAIDLAPAVTSVDSTLACCTPPVGSGLARFTEGWSSALLQGLPKPPSDSGMACKRCMRPMMRGASLSHGRPLPRPALSVGTNRSRSDVPDTARPSPSTRTPIHCGGSPMRVTAD